MKRQKIEDEEPRKRQFECKDRLAAAFFSLLVTGIISFGIATLLMMPGRRTGKSLLINWDGSLSGWYWVIGIGGALFGGLLGLVFPRLAFALGEKIRNAGRDR